MVNNVIEVRGLTVIRGPTRARRARRDDRVRGDRPARSERLRQVHAAALDRRRPAGRGRRRARCWASPPAARRCATGSATSPRSPACTTTSRSPRTCASSPACSAAPTREVDKAIDAVDLRSHADAQVGRLSGGQRSRASLAVALLGQPGPAGPRRAHGRPRPGAAPRPLDPLPPSSPTTAPRSWSPATSWTRPSAATSCCSCATGRSSPTTPRRRSRSAPAADDIESAFLKLVEERGGMSPRDHPRRRRPGAHPDPPRPSHRRDAAGAALPADLAAVVDVQGLVRRSVRQVRAGAAGDVPVHRDVPRDQRDHAARALQRHPRAAAGDADGQARLPARVRRRVRPRRRRPGAARGHGVGRPARPRHRRARSGCSAWSRSPTPSSAPRSACSSAPSRRPSSRRCSSCR